MMVKIVKSVEYYFTFDIANTREFLKTIDRYYRTLCSRDESIQEEDVVQNQG